MRYALRALLAAFLVAALLVGVGVAGGESPSPDTHPVATDSDATALQPALQSAVQPVGSGDHRLQPADRDSPSDGQWAGAIDDTSRAEAIGGESRPAQVATFDREPETDLRIELQPDRDAHWEVTVRYELTDANETAVFDDVSERFIEGEIGPSETLFERFADGASRNADREMTIENVDRSVDIYDDEEVVAVGELRLTFVWTDFLETDGNDLVLGDALTTPTNGTWLRSLSEGQSIAVATPDGYSVSGTPGATVSLRDNAVIIDGPRVFADDERVAVVYSPTGTTEAPPWTMLTAAIVLAALLIAIGLLGYRRVDAGRTDDGGAPVSPVGSAEDADSTADDGAERNAGVPADEPEEDLSLLSDEERVERLLERQGGRMRQADIVSETGWSDAKVSQLLSTMADEGRVEKLRLGRENLISLPDEEPGIDDSDAEPDADG